MAARRVTLLIFTCHFVASLSADADTYSLDNDVPSGHILLLQTSHVFANGQATWYQRHRSMIDRIVGFKVPFGGAPANRISLASFIGLLLLLLLILAALAVRRTGAEECPETCPTPRVEISKGVTISPASSQLKLNKGKENASELSYLQCSLLVSLLVLAGVYDVVLKFKALDVSGPQKFYDSFELTSILLVSSIIVVIEALVALWLFRGEGTSIWHHLSLREFFAYCPSRFAKVNARILSFVALYYVSPDVFKVIDQFGLLATALLHHFSVKVEPSPTIWALIALICMASAGYAYLCNLCTASAGGIDDPSANGSPKYIFGISLVLWQTVLRSFCDVDGERLMKKHGDTPLPVQKLYQEILTILWSIMLTPVIRYANPWGGEHADVFKMSFFRGWDNPYVIVLCAVTVLRLWLSVACNKKLTSVIKGLCANCGSTLVYFAMLIHGCPAQPTSFMCASGIRSINATIAFANVGILLLLILYVLGKQAMKDQDLVPEI